MKKGFHQDEKTPDYRRRVGTFFDDLEGHVRVTLSRGFEATIAELFARKGPSAVQEGWLIDNGTLEEMRPVVNRLMGLVR